jgi:hypothetical protein
MGEPKGGIAGDCASAVQDFRHPVGRDIELQQTSSPWSPKLGGMFTEIYNSW